MGKHPKLDTIAKRMDEGRDFALTRIEYQRLTGIDTPQDSYYTKNKSAIAKLANSKGYVIDLVPETLRFTKKH